MNKLIAMVLVAFSIFAFGGTSAQAEDCQVQVSDTCELFLQQQDAPAYDGPLADSGPVRCVWVTSNAPTALVLRNGVGVGGDPIISWRKASLQWQYGYVNAHRAYLAQICFPQHLLYNYTAVTLCGEIGHSIWRNRNMAFVRENHVPRNDPACVGGDGWCGFRGL